VFADLVQLAAVLAGTACRTRQRPANNSIPSKYRLTAPVVAALCSLWYVASTLRVCLLCCFVLFCAAEMHIKVLKPQEGDEEASTLQKWVEQGARPAAC
jgi:hypothetical protein